MTETYTVRAYRYTTGPYADPISNARHSRTTETEIVATTDDFYEAGVQVQEIKDRDDGSVAYITRSSDGAEYSGGVWLPSETVEMHTYAVAIGGSVVAVYEDPRDAGDPALIEAMDDRRATHGPEATWVHVDGPCKTGDRLEIDGDGCASVAE